MSRDRSSWRRAGVIALLLVISSALPAGAWESSGEGPSVVVDPGTLARMGLLEAEAGTVLALPGAFRPSSPEEQQELLESRAQGADPQALFGTGNAFSTVGSSDFAGVRPTTDLAIGSTGFRLHCDSTSGTWDNFAEARIDVPHGARLDWLDIWGYRTSSQHMDFFLWERCLPYLSAGNQTHLTVVNVDTSSATTDSSGNFIVTGPLFRTANTRTCYYALRVRFGDVGNGCSEGNQLAIYKARIQWRRQVSPAPESATYIDVPTGDPDFQVIEALSASGVTDSCDAQKFCPDGVVTHRLLARYLSRLLGLDWGSF